ncbi:MAG: hypothetical protein ABIJ97_07295 [Bacteroidota bacterium]
MLNIQIKYLLEDVIFLNKEITWQIELNDSINLLFNNKTEHYSEPVFDFNKPELSTEELEKLYQLSELLLLKKYNVHEIPVDLYKSSPFLKIIHFLVNEFYIIDKNIRDIHNRISSKNINPAFEKILSVPIVDVLIDLFLLKINNTCIRQKEIVFTSDFDMINLWTKLGFSRSVKRLLKFNNFSSEFRSFIYSKNKLKFNYILNDKMFYLSEHKDFKISNIAFWIVYRNNNTHDFKNCFKSRSFTDFLKHLNNKVIYGLHLAYGTSNEKEKINLQLNKFKDIFSKTPDANRYHYLKFNLPEDLKLLENEKIKTDFSYCFHDSLLFRGGRTVPVKFWSFIENRTIDVVSYPILFMDVTFSTYIKSDLNEAKILSGKKIELFQKYGNTCVLLWHNNNMYKLYEKNNYHPELFNFIKNKLLK